MAQNTQSKILSIDEQIQKLKEKRNREVAKLERNAGKRFLEKFDLENKSLEEIYTVIDTLSETYNVSKQEDPVEDLTNDKRD
ncbi:hypothetical protein [Heyndrickxia sporothermodurans]|uniref:hypothetical protein n=1 Tax=Heyndrickxia sporothermodurans TaxID=46224 RepID=UPI000D36424D|nr:hypothetical protein [Heyndrickxia sporothermodurans]PTY92340.1 hypothetical protein B5V90_03530 [Heyndrickxia sporothermodurans]